MTFTVMYRRGHVKVNADSDILASVVPTLNNSLLQHNAELTAYVTQLSMERRTLHVNIANLQQRLTTVEQTADSRTQQVLIGCLCLISVHYHHSLLCFLLPSNNISGPPLHFQ